jgi:hypothetical protein
VVKVNAVSREEYFTVEHVSAKRIHITKKYYKNAIKYKLLGRINSRLPSNWFLCIFITSIHCSVIGLNVRINENVIKYFPNCLNSNRLFLENVFKFLKWENCNTF